MENFEIIKFEFIVDKNYENARLDSVVSDLTELTRSFIKKNLIEIIVNGKNVKLSRKVKENDYIKIKLKKIVSNDKVIPQYYPLKILYEDEYFIIVNKPFKIPVHPSFGHNYNTLCNYIMDYFNKKNIFLNDAGMVHRLDMDTEGLIIFAKSKEVQNLFKEMFQERKIDKYYFAIVKGNVSPFSDILEDNLIRDPKNRLKYTITKGNKGKNAKLKFNKILFRNNYSLINIKLLTGRTHQIRVQFSKRGFPLIGDRIYSRSYKQYFDKYGLLLFSYRLNFMHPIIYKKINVINSIPERFKKFILDNMNKDN